MAGTRLPRQVLAGLHCPLCTGELTAVDGAVRCPAGHSFDLARQGYLNLTTWSAGKSTADTAEMVAARAAFLGAGNYAALAEALAGRATELATHGLILDAGANIGYYLSAVLDALPAAHGLALDLATLALRRAARAHPRLGAVVWDIWRPLPVRSASVTLILNVFAPRNGAEFRRVLRADGALLVVTPGPDHLAGLPGLLTVDPAKEQRLAASLAEHFTRTEATPLTVPMTLSASQARDLVLMGPAAHHLAPADRAEAFAALADPATVTASFVLSTYRPN